MVMSQVAICNTALGHLGEDDKLVSIDDETKAGRACKRAFGPARDALIREYPFWNFCDTNVQLTANAINAAVEDWGYRAVLPPDCISVKTVNRRGANHWERRGRHLYTNAAPPLFVRYSMRVEDTSIFDPLFDEALGYKIAEAIAVHMTGKQSVRREMAEQVESVAGRARRADARESKIPRRPPTAWHNARRGLFRPPFGIT